MKKKSFQLMMFLLIAGLMSVNAQVRIGGSSEPSPDAILDLNPDGSVPATKGLSLPRVELQSEVAPDPLSAHVKGMMVYNLTTTGGLNEGIYVNTGAGWQLLSNGTIAPGEPIVFLRNPGFAWLGLNGNATDTLFIEVANPSENILSYQWYQKFTDGSSTPVAGAIKDTLFVEKGKYGIPANPGATSETYQYYCVVIDGIHAQYGISGTGRVAAGVGARLSGGKWLRFMSFNLGADENMTLDQQIAYQLKAANAGAANDKNYDPTVYGDWYQWGRKKDGHQDRTVPASGTYIQLLKAPNGAGTDSLDTKGQIKTAHPTLLTQFIQRDGGSTFDWRQYNETADNSITAPKNEWTWGSPINGVTTLDPCRSEYGAPWRVPTQSEWAQIVSNNSWVWVDGGTNGISGYRVQPGGQNKPATIFLPAAGLRSRSTGAMFSVGAAGLYWSSSPTGTDSFGLHFNSGSISGANTYSRSSGFTVRCVAE
ncbi:hypothetical protein FACS189413_04180 [Bacteroidia bacterium]|nr:hypothetical protein FACS189413_04180 [Bacteroidia bacterium]